jgi:hypothetical protein
MILDLSFEWEMVVRTRARIPCCVTTIIVDVGSFVLGLPNRGYCMYDIVNTRPVYFPVKLSNARLMVMRKSVFYSESIMSLYYLSG